MGDYRIPCGISRSQEPVDMEIYDLFHVYRSMSRAVGRTTRLKYKTHVYITKMLTHQPLSRTFVCLCDRITCTC